MTDVASEGRASEETTGQLRGSTLLTAGRGVSLAINFATQVLIVRHLSQEGYGAFAYALSLVAVGETAVTLGLDRAITRFVPIYDERREDDKLLGTLLLCLGVVTLLGAVLVLAALGARDLLGVAISDPQAVSLVLIMVALAPIQAYDGLLVGMFAVFGDAWAVFLRKHVMAPLLRLAAAALLITYGADSSFLALGYVIGGAVGTAIVAGMLMRLLARSGMLDRLRRARPTIPGREVFGFALPLLSSDLVLVLLTASDVVLLEAFRGTEEVAQFRVIHPLAHLNQFAFMSFSLLFTPVAARFFARGDLSAMNGLYWRTATWMAVLTFPVFALTFALAGPLTTTLYGDEYASSGLYLALLAAGYYFNVALGFNGLVLKVVGRVRYIVILNVAAAVANVILNLLLIPPLGPLGAAIGTATTLALHNILKHIGLRFGTGVSMFETSTIRIYVVLAAATGALVLASSIDLSLEAQIAVVGAATVAVLILCRDALAIAETFPAVLKLPLGRRLFGR